MSYLAAVEHLNSLGLELAPPPADGDGPTAGLGERRKFDLDHMRKLAVALNDPQRQFQSVLISGTNGKGSTAATLASILTAAGIRTGLYTSPHLSRVNERVQVTERTGDGLAAEDETKGRLCELAEIPDEKFARLYDRVDEAAAKLVAEGVLPHAPSFFEVLTALAFLYFAEMRVEVAVLEVGLGGRLDATNIVEPVLAVITDIALDHQEYLGDTLGEIAREKAGILRRAGTLVTLPQHPEANQAIGEVAMELGVRGANAAEFLPDRVAHPPFEGGTDWDGDSPVGENRYRVGLGGATLEVRSPLAGEHQRRNIALAIAAAVELRTGFGYKITDAALAAGISRTRWPGRLEFLAPNLLLDVAHNPAGAWTLRAAIAEFPETRPRTLLFSCLRDKDLTAMARILFPLFDKSSWRPDDHVVFAPIDNPRATRVGDLLAAAAAVGVPAYGSASVEEALTLARRLTPEGGIILVTGSVYLVGEVRGLVLGA